MSSADAPADDERYRSEIESITGIGESWRNNLRKLTIELREAVPVLLEFLTYTETASDPKGAWKSVQSVLPLIPKWERQLQVALDDVRQAKAKWDSESASRSQDVDLMTASVEAQRKTSIELEKRISEWETQIDSSRKNLTTIQQEVTRVHNLLQPKLTELQAVEPKIRDSGESWSNKENELRRQDNDKDSTKPLVWDQKRNLSQQRPEARLFLASVQARERQAGVFEAQLEDSRRAMETQKRELAEYRRLLDEDRNHLKNSRQANERQEREIAESHRLLNEDRQHLEDSRQADSRQVNEAQEHEVSRLEERKRGLEVRETAYETSNAKLQEEREAFDGVIQRLRDDERNMSNLLESSGAIVNADRPKGIQGLLSEIDNHVRDLLKKFGEAGANERRVGDLSQELEATKAEFRACRRDLQRLDQQREQASVTAGQRQQTISELTAELRACYRDMKRLGQQREEARVTAEQHQQTISDLKGEDKLLHMEISELEEKMFELEDEGKFLRMEIEDFKSRNMEQEEKILKSKVKSSNSTRVHGRSLLKDITTLESHKLQLQNEIKTLQDRFAILQTRLGHKEEELLDKERNIQEVSEERDVPRTRTPWEGRPRNLFEQAIFNTTPLSILVGNITMRTAGTTLAAAAQQERKARTDQVQQPGKPDDERPKDQGEPSGGGGGA